MSWKKAMDFGVVKFEKNRVKLYYDNLNFESIQLPNDYMITDARWAGSAVVIYLSNSKVRRYTSKDNYSTIN